VELDAVAQPALDQAGQIHGADIVVGVIGQGGNGWTENAAALVHDAIEKFSDPPRAVLVVDEAVRIAPGMELPVPVLTCKLSGTAAIPSLQATLNAYQAIFGIGGKLGARACGVIASDLLAVTPQWIDRLVRPVLDLESDFVTPRYARHKWEGLLNRSILSPLSRALYGRQVQNPMGPDCGASARLMQSILGDPHLARRADPAQALGSMLSAAVRDNLQVAEANLGAPYRPAVDWMNLSTLLAEILGPVFLDLEWNAALWQRVRGSQAVPIHGDPETAANEGGAVDANRLVDSFQLGAQNLVDIWNIVLPPTNLLEIRRLARVPADRFRMADDLWVSIVYDFALAHRMRTINRDHLLRSFTPLYLGWVASYAMEMETASSPVVEARLERLARAYEAGKPYLVSRWRWPDRFNP
jgi:hypothetical protein